MASLSAQRVVIVGLGKSGMAAARLALREGATVVGTDARPRSQLGDDVLGSGIEVVAGGHAGVDWAKADLVVVSPGVPRLAELDRALSRGVPVIGELELAWRYLEAPVLAVGGTNGKSTTTTLLALFLEASGARVFSGGNLGTPLSEATSGRWDFVVAEVSSFQLERAPTFRPHVSILLNISDDHLDRYDDLADYARAKGNAFVNQTPGDVAIVPQGDAACLEQARRGAGRIVTFGAAGDYAVEGRAVVEQRTGERFSLADSALFGAHNLANAAAAAAAARAVGAEAGAIGEGLARFQPLPHRMALAGEVGGVKFFDDSKATNVGAAVTAVRGLDERVVLIAGGRDKLGSYAPLIEALEARGRGLVVLGEAASRLLEAARARGGASGRPGEPRLPVARAATLGEAVRLAYGMASPGDAVLLSPACSSFDMFRSYAERGDEFVAAVGKLREERP